MFRKAKKKLECSLSPVCSYILYPPSICGWPTSVIRFFNRPFAGLSFNTKCFLHHSTLFTNDFCEPTSVIDKYLATPRMAPLVLGVAFRLLTRTHALARGGLAASPSSAEINFAILPSFPHPFPSILLPFASCNRSFLHDICERGLKLGVFTDGAFFLHRKCAVVRVLCVHLRHVRWNSSNTAETLLSGHRNLCIVWHTFEDRA